MIQLSKKKANRTFNNRFYIKRRISAGSFGVVFLCSDLLNNGYVALKVEKDEGDNIMSLERETYILEKLQFIPGIPKFLWHGFEHGHNCIALELLGKDLSFHLKQYRRFTLKTVCNIAEQLIVLIEQVHLKNIVHRDIKPENIITGREGEQNILYLVDFGISKCFVDENGNHIAFKEGRPFMGTTRYASISAHHGYELSRRDDLESLGYVFIYMLKGKLVNQVQGILPWQNILSNNDKEKAKLVGQSKTSMDIEELCKDIPSEFKRYFQYVKNLTFLELPDYKYLSELISKIALNNGFMIDKKFDWLDLNSNSTQSVLSKRHGSRNFSNSPSPLIPSQFSSNYIVGEKRDQSRHKKSQIDSMESSQQFSQGDFLKPPKKRRIKGQKFVSINNDNGDSDKDSVQNSVFLNNYIPSNYQKDQQTNSFLPSVKKKTTFLDSPLIKSEKRLQDNQFESLQFITTIVPKIRQSMDSQMLKSQEVQKSPQHEGNLFHDLSQNFQDLEALDQMLQSDKIHLQSRQLKSPLVVKSIQNILPNINETTTQTFNFDDFGDDGPQLQEKLQNLCLPKTIFKKRFKNF